MPAKLAPLGVKAEHIPALVDVAVERHLPPDQSAALHRGGLRADLRVRDLIRDRQAR